jgi:ABC-type glycerol-3-phosphate transport system permease component
MAATSIRPRFNGESGHVVRSVLFYLALGLFLISVLLPLYYIFLAAFVPGDRVFTKPLTYLPQDLGFDRYQQILDEIPIPRYVFNTFLIATVSTLVTILVSFLAAYAIARLQFPGANLVLIGLLASSMLPSAASVIPLFQMYQELGLMNTFRGLLLLYVSALLPITVWVLVSFIRQVPVEIEEAARVDGAGFIELIRRIVFPMILPAMATMFLVNFIINWNEFFTPLIFARGESTKVITMALTEAQGLGANSQYYQNWGNMSAVAIIATIPVFVVTLVFQRQITEGITAGAVK